MPKLTFDPSFFKSERDRAYADWVLAEWRELFQNSCDAGAGRIDITLDSLPNNNVRLVFQDDGPGMSRDVLNGVYFSVGATTKGGSGQTGGFGRARILTCFSMAGYEIRSQDYRAVGKADDYEIHDEAEFLNGCRLTIEIDDVDVPQLQSKLDEFLSESRMTCDIYVNGVRNLTNSGHQGRFISELTTFEGDVETPFAKVYVNKSNKRHRVIIRVNGMSMFSYYTDADAQVVIELDPAKARSVLTSNRDSLRGNYRFALSKFQRQLATDTKSAIRSRFKRRTQVFSSGTGMKKVSRPQARAKRTAGADSIPDSQVFVISLTDNARADDARLDRPQGLVQAEEYTDDARLDRPQGLVQAEEYTVESGLSYGRLGRWLATTFGDIYVFDETEIGEMHAAVSKFVPESWQPVATKEGKTILKGANSIKLLLLWHTAITYAIEVGLEPLGLNDLTYSVGFIFKDDDLAECRKNDDGYVFGLRPVDRSGKSAYSVSDRTSQKKLMAFAKHEVAHVDVDWHNEQFSSMREAIDWRFDESECLRRMKAALNAMPDFSSRPMLRAA